MNPGPIPTEWSVGEFITPDGRKWHLLRFATPIGEQVYWFEGEALDVLINALRQARGAIVVPPSSEVLRFGRELRDRDK